jgi:hypothetical protein
VEKSSDFFRQRSEDLEVGFIEKLESGGDLRLSIANSKDRNNEVDSTLPHKQVLMAPA